MKIFRLLTASLLIAVCAELGSCSSEEEIPTLLEIDCQQAENFLSEGIIASPFQCYFEITVTANKSWTSTINYNDSQKDWCEYHPASMDITNDMSMSTFTNVRLMIAQNTSGEERSATITITTGDISKSFTIKQKQNDVISLSTDLIKSNSNGGNYQIEVTSNIDYDVQIPTEHQDWVKFSNRTKAISTNNIEFTIAPNLNYDKRECDIYIIPKNGIITESLAPSLHILQLPKSLIELDKLQETFPKEGGNAIFLLTTNTEYEVVIDKTYSWIKLDKIENAQAKVQKLYISVSETETFIRAAIASNTPSTTPNIAANSTRISPGRRNVMVCAGYQKKEIVFLKTKFHCASQFRCVMMRVIGIGVRRLRGEPPQSRICVSVILWNVMNTGAKMVFIATEMARAIHNLSRQNSPFIMAAAFAIPIYSMNCGTPLEKIIMAALIPIPSSPHTMARGSTPNPFRL